MTTKTISKLYQDHEKCAEFAGLSYVVADPQGYLRKKHGKKFIFTDTRGNDVVNEKIQERLQALRIPPMWHDVAIAKNANAHIQAIGYDAKGRKQYIYHHKWREIRDLLNFYRMITFGEKLGILRTNIESHFNEEGLTKEKVIAAILKIIDTLHIRVGNEQYAVENNTYGLTTMLDEHVKVKDNAVIFNFVGKAKKKHQLEIKDSHIAEIVKESKEITGEHLFQYVDSEGNHRTISSQDINDYIKKVTGEQFTAKDFRTWTGTSEMFRLLKHTVCTVERDYIRNINKSIQKVAESLGNTKAVARKHYIHPELIRCYKNKEFFEKLKSLKRRMKRETYLKQHELELIIFLKDSLRKDITTLKK